MTLEQIADKVVETDVLVVGGGIGGCCAALKAKEHGLDVTIVEKANIERSGSAGQGIDHYGSFPGDGVTGLSIAKGKQRFDMRLFGEGRWADFNIMCKIYKNMWWILGELEKHGVPTKWGDGEYYFIPAFKYGGVQKKVMLRVHWERIKPHLAAAVKRNGIPVIQRTMVVDLLTNKGAVVGATAVNVRTGEFIVIRSKATIIATGNFSRLYDPDMPTSWKYKMKYIFCPASLSGDGQAVAYRAGAELVNMDLTAWELRIRDDAAIPFGHLGTNDGIYGKMFTADGEEILIPPTAKKCLELELKGKTPLYQSILHLPDDFHKRVEVAIADERPMSFAQAEERGFNPRTHVYESTTHHVQGVSNYSGIFMDDEFETSLKGLYAAGDVAAIIMGCALSTGSGFLAGDSAATFVKEVREPVIDEGQVEAQKRTALAPMSVKDGVEPLELECAVRYIAERYIAERKSEGKLIEGLKRLGTLRRVWLPKLIAQNSHYLMGCLECRNILDLAEVHVQASLERKETRGDFIRFDYPRTDPMWTNKCIFQRMEDGKAVLEIREMPELKPDYEKEGE